MELVDVAPALGYLYSSGAAAMALLILAIPASVMGVYLTYKRRFDTIGALPCERCGQVLARPAVTVSLHAITAGLLFIAWAQYAGVMNSQFSDITFRAVFGVPIFGGEDADSIYLYELVDHWCFCRWDD